MSDRTLIPRHGQPDPAEGVPETCPGCRSINLRIEGDEWRCNRCYEQRTWRP